MMKITEALEEMMWIVEETMNKSTVRGRRTANKALVQAIDQVGLTDVSELDIKMNMMQVIKQIGIQISNGEWGAYSTNSQKYHTIKAILSDIGVSAITVDMFAKAKTKTLENGDTTKSVQETITIQQVQECMTFIENAWEGNIELKVKGSVVSKLKIARGRLYFHIASSYALRQESIMKLNKVDMTHDSLTYRIMKGEAKGTPVRRSMNNLVWQSYEDYVQLMDNDRQHLFNDASWLSAFTKVVMTNCGVESAMGRHGIHRFRRAFATWAYDSGIVVEKFSPALNHKNTEVTENVYIDLDRKQQVGSQIIDEYQGAFLGIEERLTEVETDMIALSKFVQLNMDSTQVNYDDCSDSHKACLKDCGVTENASLSHVSIDGKAVTDAMEARKEALLPNPSSSLGAGTTFVGLLNEF